MSPSRFGTRKTPPDSGSANLPHGIRRPRVPGIARGRLLPSADHFDEPSAGGGRRGSRCAGSRPERAPAAPRTTRPRPQPLRRPRSPPMRSPIPLECSRLNRRLCRRPSKGQYLSPRPSARLGQSARIVAAAYLCYAAHTGHAHSPDKNEGASDRVARRNLPKGGECRRLAPAKQIEAARRGIRFPAPPQTTPRAGGGRTPSPAPGTRE